MWRRSEGIPGRVRRKLEITNVGAKPQANPRADRHNDNVARGQRRHAEATDEIGGAIDTSKALIDRAGRWQAIDEHHGTSPLATVVETHGWTFPEHAPVARVLGVELAVAVSQTNHKSAAAFLTENITIGLTPAADSRFNDLRQAPRNGSEESVALAHQFAGRERAALLGGRRWRRRLVLCSGQSRSKSHAQCQGGEAQGRAHQMLHWRARGPV